MITLPKEDFEFLERVEALGAEGLSDNDIAERLELNPSTFRFRVRELGFRMGRQSFLVTQLGGRRFSELKTSGELMPEAPAEAVRA